jgi:CBS domain-containing protein
MKTHVVTVEPDARLAEAIDLMDVYQVRSLPVVTADGLLCGMLSECDVTNALQIAAATARRPVREVMSAPAIAVREEDTARDACDILLSCGLNRVPVLRSDGKVVGVLNRVDVLQALFEGHL